MIADPHVNPTMQQRAVTARAGAAFLADCAKAYEQAGDADTAASLQRQAEVRLNRLRQLEALRIPAFPA